MTVTTIARDDQFSALFGTRRGLTVADALSLPELGYWDEERHIEWTRAELESISDCVERAHRVPLADYRLRRYRYCNSQRPDAEAERTADEATLAADDGLAGETAEDEGTVALLVKCGFLSAYDASKSQPVIADMLLKSTARLLADAGKTLKMELAVRDGRETCAACGAPYELGHGWKEVARGCPPEQLGVSDSVAARRYLDRAERRGPLCRPCVERLRRELPGRVAHGRCAWCSPRTAWDSDIGPTADRFESPEILSEEQSELPCCWDCAGDAENGLCACLKLEDLITEHTCRHCGEVEKSVTGDRDGEARVCDKCATSHFAGFPAS